LKPQNLLDGFYNGKYNTLRVINNKAIVNFNTNIGTYYQGGNLIGPTKYGIIHFSKAGAHIVPANPIQY